VWNDDEIVTEIQVLLLCKALRQVCLRKSIDFPIVNCAAAIDGGSARICLNAVKGIPYRATKAEESIAGKAINAENAEVAGAAAVQGSMSLSGSGESPGNKYKIQIAKTMVKRAILACA
jgi:CO/xanthine dehydrogenase FAD-binding subunit